MTNRINKAYGQLEQEYEREPTPEELAEILEIDAEEVTASLGMSARHVSVDQPLAEGEDTNMIDVLEDTNVSSPDHSLVVDDSLQTDIERTLGVLSERQSEVIRYFFGLGTYQLLSLEDIGERFGLTYERVRQIKDKAITKLRQSPRSRSLRGYLG